MTNTPFSKRKNVIAVLLATYNGEPYLEEQLDSLASQTHNHVDIWMSDDGSTDSTIAIAKEKARSWKKGKFTILRHNSPLVSERGDAAGWVEARVERARQNFVSLIINRDIVADYYAYCDQDDVWEEDKLAVALQTLEKADSNKPAMYCSRTKIIDAKGNIVGKSPLFQKPPCFRNALVQNIAAGNTIVFNQRAMDILRKYSVTGNFIGHDWWTYIVVSGFEGTVIYDPVPRTRYRQHEANVIGSNAPWLAKLTRIRLLLQGRFRYWNQQNIQEIDRFVQEIPQENRSIFLGFKKMNRAPPVIGVYYLYRCGLFRQTMADQILLYIGCLFGKI